jgi:nucleoside-diphosphate-sugar epimerase
MRVLIIGCGYVGVPLGQKLVQAGHEVVGMRRSPVANGALSSVGIQPANIDITKPGELERIAPKFDWVINLASSTRGGLEEYRQVYLEGTRNVLGWLRQSPPARYLYTSSTSVYGQSDGSIVDEKSATEPESATSGVLVETEQELLRADWMRPMVLRVAGIYGPERGHLFKQFVAGEAALRGEGETWINMVHLEDIAGSIIHLLEKGGGNEIYNVIDDEPVTQKDFFAWLATRLGKPMPPSAAPDLNRKRGLTNKRVSNGKLRSTGYLFRYPTFREGYESEIQRLKLTRP